MKMRVSSSSALSLLLLASSAFAEEKACTTHAGNKFYDLNPLRASKDNELRTPNDHRLVFNICGRITTETFGLKDFDAAQIGGFLRRDHGDVSIGTLNTTVVVEDSHPRLYFLDGSPCNGQSDNNGPRISTVIDFVCDTSIFGTGKPRLVASFPPYDDEKACGFAIEWRTQFACPTSEGGAWGIIAILAVLSLSLLVTYTILGTLYNRYVLNLRGFDQIPQFSIEGMRYHATEAWDWGKDVIASYQQNGGFSSYRNGYQQGPTSPPRGPNSGQGALNPGGFIRTRATPSTNPVSHHAQSQGDPELGGGGVGGGPGGGGIGLGIGGGGGDPRSTTPQNAFVRPHSSNSNSNHQQFSSNHHQPRASGPMAIRGLETNPVSHFTQSQAQLHPSSSPSPPRQFTSSAPLPPLPGQQHPQQHQPQQASLSVAAPQAVGGQSHVQAQQQPQELVPVQPRREFGVGSDEEDDDDDEDEDDDENENAPLAGQGGGGSLPPPPPKDGGRGGGAIRI